MARAFTTVCFLMSLLQATLPTTSLPPVLTRDVDKRPLAKVGLAELSPLMKSTVLHAVGEKPRPETYTLSRVPVAPHDHKLYLLEQSGKDVCAVNGPNCPETVFDETPQGVVTVADWGGVGMAVVRRPNLQMPDIATYEQLGHFSTYTTVYRFSNKGWKPLLCNETSLQGMGDPHPEWVAYQACNLTHPLTAPRGCYLCL